MRSSVLLLPVLLLVSPGDGTSPRRASPPPEAAWNPLRPWQRLSPDVDDTARRLLTPPRELPACPMPVAPLAADSKPARPSTPAVPLGSFGVFWDSIDRAGRFSMPIVRSGCWNPLFRKTVPETAKDTSRGE